MSSQENGFGRKEMKQFYHQAEKGQRLIGGMGLDIGEQIHIFDLVDQMEKGDDAAHRALLGKYVELAAQARISFSCVSPANPLYDPEYVEVPSRLRKKAIHAFLQMHAQLEYKGYVFVVDNEVGGCWLEKIPTEE